MFSGSVIFGSETAFVLGVRIGSGDSMSELTYTSCSEFEVCYCVEGESAVSAGSVVADTSEVVEKSSVLEVLLSTTGSELVVEVGASVLSVVCISTSMSFVLLPDSSEPASVVLSFVYSSIFSIGSELFAEI